MHALDLLSKLESLGSADAFETIDLCSEILEWLSLRPTIPATVLRRLELIEIRPVLRSIDSVVELAVANASHSRERNELLRFSNWLTEGAAILAGIDGLGTV